MKPLINEKPTINLQAIDTYGSHISVMHGIKGRILSALHWDSQYDQNNLFERFVQAAQSHSNRNVSFDNVDPKFTSFIDAFNKIREHNLTEFDFAKANSRHIVQLANQFKDEPKKLELAITNYGLLKKEIADFDVNAYIQAILKQPDLNAISQTQLKTNITQAAKFADQVTSIIGGGLIFETALLLGGYLYDMLPLLNAYLATNSMLISSFWPFFIAGFLAQLSVIVIGGLISGAWNKREQGIILGAYQGLQETWNAQVLNEDSFHPIIDSAIGAAFVAFWWLYIGQLERAVVVGSYLHMLMQYGIRDHVFKYTGMNLFFTLKAELHQGSVRLGNLSKCVLFGALRGVVKNPMLDSLTKSIVAVKLSEALSLSKYTPFLAETYLKEWWVPSIEPSIKGFVWLLGNSPERLITALWLSRDISDVLITNASKFAEIVFSELLYPYLQLIPMPTY